MNIKDYEYVVAVAELGNISKAAERKYMQYTEKTMGGTDWSILWCLCWKKIINAEMAESYISQMESPALKLRWISVQCYEMVLPNGKVIVTDPFYLDKSYYDRHPEAQAGEKRYTAERDFLRRKLPERTISY